MQKVYDLYSKLHENIDDIYDYELLVCDIALYPIAPLKPTGILKADDENKKLYIEVSYIEDFEGGVEK